MGLTFDAEGCYRALVDRLIDTMNQVMDAFYQEAIMGLDSDGRADIEIEKSHVTSETMYKGNLKLGDAPEFISTKAKFYANAIMQSFGTGVYADTSTDSYWDEYMQSSLWNKRRRGIAIEGREKGEYTNIFGEKETSSGKNAGKVLPSFILDDYGNRIELNKPGSHSIQTAEAWVIKDGETRVERYIERAVNDFFANEAKKFFIFV